MQAQCLSFRLPTLNDACTCRNRYRPVQLRLDDARVDDVPSTNIQKKLVRWKYLRRTWRMQLIVERVDKVSSLSWNMTMKCCNMKNIITSI